MLNSVKNVIDATVESISSRWPENLYWVGMEAQLHFRTLKRLPSEVTLWQTRANRLRLRDGYAGLSLLSDNTTQNRSEITTL